MSVDLFFSNNYVSSKVSYVTLHISISIKERLVKLLTCNGRDGNKSVGNCLSIGTPGCTEGLV